MPGDLTRDIGCKHAQLQFVDRQVENVLGAFPGVEDALLYGVKIPGTVKYKKADLKQASPTA